MTRKQLETTTTVALLVAATVLALTMWQASSAGHGSVPSAVPLLVATPVQVAACAVAVLAGSRARRTAPDDGGMEDVAGPLPAPLRLIAPRFSDVSNVVVMVVIAIAWAIGVHLAATRGADTRVAFLYAASVSAAVQALAIVTAVGRTDCQSIVRWSDVEALSVGVVNDTGYRHYAQWAAAGRGRDLDHPYAREVLIRDDVVVDEVWDVLMADPHDVEEYTRRGDLIRERTFRDPFGRTDDEAVALARIILLGERARGRQKS